MSLARALLRRFARDRRGNVFVIFGLSATVLVTAIGAGVDLANAYVVRQKLSNIATLTCQFANRPTNLAMIDNGPSGPTNYKNTVNGFRSTTLVQQAFQAQLMAGTNPPTAPVTYDPNGQATQVVGSATVNTIFMTIIGVSSLPVAVTVPCGSPGAAPPPQANGTIISEGFENSPCSGTCYSFILPNGKVGEQAPPSQTAPATTSYTGLGGTQFKTIGYCLEIDSVGVIRNSVPEGSHSAELDCDNGNGSAGNSSISTMLSLKTGEYELRYNYVSRLSYSNYRPAYICGSTASDVAWANDTYGPNVTRSNQINAYFDQDTGGGIPLHTTLDGTQKLGGSNLIDICVDSANWIERSVRITVTTAGNYWLSFAADGQSDSYGGQLDNIRFCNNPCPGTLQDNFPFPTPGQVLFEDNFENPTTAQSCGAGGCGNVTTTLNAFYGTSGSTASGWPGEASRGWATAPYNQTDIEFISPTQGSQYVQVEGNANSNHTISRYFYLDPGYYQINYFYISDVLFSALPSTNCAYPAYTNSSFAPIYPTQTTSSGGTNRISNGSGTWLLNTNELAVFMSHSQLVSYPNGGGALNSTTSFTNPDGSVSTTATVPPDSLNIYAYNASAPNALIDFCLSSPSWTLRTTPIKITKPGQYWLSFASMGAADGLGGAIDDVKLIALGSPYMSSPPASATTIPTAGPAPGSSISYTGFSFIADPFKPPAP